MEKKTIGGFMAALRKANGMTQQDVADRLNVSNKAVSRWERDENAPDITLIPALAELFGVTCDELLRGERIAHVDNEKAELRVEKQRKALLNRALSDFKVMTWISLALSTVGLICMFGIAYGFYRPIIGFAVMLLPEAGAVLLEVIAVTKLRDLKTENELLENAESSYIRKLDHVLAVFSFTAFFASGAVVLLSLPLVLFTSAYVNSVLAIGTYFTVFFIGIVLLLTVLWLRLREPFGTWITGQAREQSKAVKEPLRRRLNLLQLGSVVLAGVLFVIAPWFESDPYTISVASILINVTALVLLAVNIVSFIVVLCRAGEKRRGLVLTGIRNLLLIPSGFFMSMVHTAGFVSYEDEFAAAQTWEQYDCWSPEYAALAIGSAVGVWLVFALVELLIKRHRSI